MDPITIGAVVAFLVLRSKTKAVATPTTLSTPGTASGAGPAHPTSATVSRSYNTAQPTGHAAAEGVSAEWRPYVVPSIPPLASPVNLGAASPSVTIVTKRPIATVLAAPTPIAPATAIATKTVAPSLVPGMIATPDPTQDFCERRVSAGNPLPPSGSIVWVDPATPGAHNAVISKRFTQVPYAYKSGPYTLLSMLGNEVGQPGVTVWYLEYPSAEWNNACKQTHRGI